MSMTELSELEIKNHILEALDSQTETEKIEFKDARGGIPGDLWKAISAFSNTPNGGLIVFGVQETNNPRKLTVVGNKDLATLQEKIISLINEKMKNCSQYSLKKIQLESHDLLSLVVSESPREQKPCYYLDLGMPRGACIRVGNVNRQISEEELRSFLRYSPEYKYDRLKLEELSLNDLDQEKIKDFLQKSADRTNRNNVDNLSFDKVLRNLEVMATDRNGDVPTLAGYLVFAKDKPKEVDLLRRYTVRCVRYAGKTVTTPILNQQEIYGTLDYQIEETYKFILKNIKLGSRIVGTKRIDTYEYPEDAIREIIANALIHRDYIITGTYVQIVIFSDRIEFANPGNLPPGVTIENLKDSQFSRNEVIANLMRSLDYMEEFGRGIDLVYARMSEYGLAEPLFKNKSNMFKVTLLGDEFKILNERQIKIWHYLQDNTQVTVSSLKKILFPDLGRSTLNSDLKKMVDIGLISIKGQANSTYYEAKY